MKKPLILTEAALLFCGTQVFAEMDCTAHYQEFRKILSEVDNATEG